MLDQEQRIIGFARAGKGIFRPLAPGKTDGLDGLSDEQKAAVRHVWDSTDQVMLIRGGAGTGKTTMMTPALAQLGVPVVLLAPSADASRGQLRKEGFHGGQHGGGVPRQQGHAGAGAEAASSGSMRPGCCRSTIWTSCAAWRRTLDARIVLQGDPAQHKAVQRHGNMLEVLEDYAGLPVAELTKIQRQKGDYAEAVGGDPRRRAGEGRRHPLQARLGRRGPGP